MLDSKRASVRVNALIAFGITLLGLGFAIFVGMHWPFLVEPALVSRLSYALQWDLLVALPLLTTVAHLGRHRYQRAMRIEDGGTPEEEGAEDPRGVVIEAYLLGMLELAGVAFMVHLAFVVAMPVSWLFMLPAAALLFLIGRVVTWIGYVDGAPARTLGFGLSFYPTVIMFAAIVLYKAFYFLAG